MEKMGMRLALDHADASAWQLPRRWLALGARVLRERPLWLAVAIGLLALALAYQSPRPLLVDMGGPYDNAVAAGFYAPEQQAGATFRWSGAQSTVRLRGLGRPLGAAAVVVRLQLSSGRPAGSPAVPVTVRANGHALPVLQVGPGSASYDLAVAPALIDASGDLRLDLTAPTFQPPGERRPLGFLCDFVLVAPVLGPVLPAPVQLLWLLVAAALIYGLLRAAWIGARAAGALTTGFLLVAAVVIAGQRLLLTAFTGRLAATLVLALLVTILAETGTRALARAAGWRGASALPEWAWAGLRGLVALGVALKVGGLLYPESFIIDAYFHLKYITYMQEFFAGGRDWEQYFGRSLALAVMPRAEWGSARAFVPYSPAFYVLAAPLGWLSMPLTITVPALSGVLGALQVPMVFLLGVGLGGPTAARAARVGLAAAAVLAFVPALFLLQQWGNWPTLLSLWAVTAWVAFTALFWRAFLRPAVWVASTVLLAATILSYLVTALYTGIFLGLLLVAGWVFAPADRRRWAALAVSGVAAAILSLLVYYGQYVDDVLGSTLPTFGSAIQEQGKLTTLRPALGEFFTGHLAGAMSSYALIVLYGLAGAGTLLLLGRRVGWLPWQRIWLGVWLLTFPLFTAADFYVDQALKEFWFALPAVAVVAGAWLVAVAARGRAGSLLVAAVGAVLVWQSLILWGFRLLFHNR
ncbi:MAG TPA: hypothetical protein VM536_15835 [Chloroflexia bacterium]|nr:hypothetical protein [Chloroflexia bacterium]